MLTGEKLWFGTMMQQTNHLPVALASPMTVGSIQNIYRTQMNPYATKK